MALLCGPYPDVTVSDEDGKNIEFGLFDGDLDALKKIDPLEVHRMCEEISNEDLGIKLYSYNC